MADLTPERLAELRRIAEAATPGPWRMHSEPEFSGPWSVGADHLPDSTVATAWAIEWSAEAAQANAQHIAAFDPTTALELLDALDAARAEAERLKVENEHLYSRIERLEARVARQRVMLHRLQEAIEHRNSEERIEAMRRALQDETVEWYIREYDAAADEAERWRKQYEALLAELAAASDVVEAARRVVNNEYDADPADVYELGEAIRRYDERRGGVSR